MKPRLIESQSQMQALTTELRQQAAAADGLIAVDTEFFRETTYYPKLALVQIATADLVACIDPLAFDAREALGELLLDQQLCKIFHSCSQDMEVLYYYLGAVPQNIYDTQLAHALLSDQQQVGYAALVEKELGVQLDKSQTRTNWLQRPLTAKQIEYAGDDVLYLYQLHHCLDTRLDQAGRKDWFEQDSRLFNCSADSFEPDLDSLHKRVKGSNRISRDKLAIVQGIAVWREKLAMEKNLTRRKLLADDIVIDLAFKAPQSLRELKPLLGRYRFTENELKALLQSIEQSRQLPSEQWPDNSFSLLDDEQKGLLKQLQAQLAASAEALGLSTGILCSRKDLEKLIKLWRDAPLAQQEAAVQQLPVCQGWRYEQIGEALLDTIKNAK